jgi:hypothetical protein
MVCDSTFIKQKHTYVLCIDFDGTIVDFEFPKIIGFKPHAKEILDKLHRDGHTIIISSCRINEAFGDMIRFLKDNDIKYDYANSNLPSRVQFFGGDCRKISADVYLDDHAYPQCKKEIDWLEFYDYICEMSK